jgi:hypothetical protein
VIFLLRGARGAVIVTCWGEERGSERGEGRGRGRGRGERKEERAIGL